MLPLAVAASTAVVASDCPARSPSQKTMFPLVLIAPLALHSHLDCQGCGVVVWIVGLAGVPLAINVFRSKFG